MHPEIRKYHEAKWGPLKEQGFTLSNDSPYIEWFIDESPSVKILFAFTNNDRPLTITYIFCSGPTCKFLNESDMLKHIKMKAFT